MFLLYIKCIIFFVAAKVIKTIINILIFRFVKVKTLRIFARSFGMRFQLVLQKRDFKKIYKDR
ncbi:hypothetical protein D1815_00885 [Aquimarina sp. AD1]|nr:hypothetical protein D1815_00885 [Aquimarina sp. AD1]RKN22922.1 hypothetical protein D7035_12055 [Aquimarina sp. AD1]